MATALAGLGQGEIAALLAHLSIVKENLRQALQKKQPILEKQYG
jgi:hypothetical protein